MVEYQGIGRAGDQEEGEEEHSVLIKPATLEVRHFLNMTSLTVLLLSLVLYVLLEEPAALVSQIFHFWKQL